MLDRVTIERMRREPGPIIVGLSGGGDSTALLHLLSEQFGPARLHVIVVDHGLRAGSASDAECALRFAQNLNVSGQVATLQWPQGVRSSQRAAREGRYGALCNFARRHGARVVAVAHNADDQEETVLMRAAGGSSWRGLAGMAAFAPAPVWPEGRGIWLARPLLGSRREELRAFLRARGAEWIDDPANGNDAFERVRARRRLEQLSRAGFEPKRLAHLAERLTAHAHALDAAAARLIADAVTFDDEAALIARGHWRGPEAVRQRALGVVVTAVGGGRREPGNAPLAALEQDLTRTTFSGRTLSGSRLVPRGATIALQRDLGAVLGRSDGTAPTPPMKLESGVETVWDGRLAITAPSPGWTVNAEEASVVLVNKGVRVGLLGSGFPHRWLLEERVKHLLHKD